jgi:large subunit ribosomal protein L1
MKEEVLEAVKKARSGKKRGFVQSFDLILTLRDIDVKKPENRFSEILELPKGRGKEASVVLFSDATKEAGCPILGRKKIEVLGKDKRALKKLAARTDFFLADPPLMPLIGKNLGTVLGPRRKMPTVVREDVKRLVESLKKSIRIEVRESPTIQCLVGNEDMKDEEVRDNVLAVIDFLKGKLPRGIYNIRSAYIKLTMGTPVKFEVR